MIFCAKTKKRTSEPFPSSLIPRAELIITEQSARIRKQCLAHRSPLPLNPTKKQLPKGSDGEAEAEEDVTVKEEQVSSDGIEKENLEVTEWRGHRGPRLVNEEGRLL